MIGFEVKSDVRDQLGQKSFKNQLVVDSGFFSDVKNGLKKWQHEGCVIYA